MKKCPYCAEEIQDAATVCRFCGRELPEYQKPAPPPAVQPQKKKSRLGCIVLGLIGLVIILLVIVNLGDEGPTNNLPTGDDAAFMCQQFVTDRLKAPKTADFASHSEERIVKDNENTWTVTSYVDSQNSFGALIRTVYTCQVINKGGDKWQLLDLQTVP